MFRHRGRDNFWQSVTFGTRLSTLTADWLTLADIQRTWRHASIRFCEYARAPLRVRDIGPADLV